MTHDHDPNFTNPKLNGATPMSADKIAAVLAAHQVERGHRDLRAHCTCGWESLTGPRLRTDSHTAHQAEMVAVALEPATREREAAHDAEVAAKTLEDAADAIVAGIPMHTTPGQWLRARAASIRADQ